MGGKQRGGGAVERDAPAVGEQDNTTASHMWVRGRGVGVKAVGAAHSGIVIRGGDAADNVERNGSFLPLGSPGTKHSSYCMFV